MEKLAALLQNNGYGTGADGRSCHAADLYLQDGQDGRVEPRLDGHERSTDGESCLDRVQSLPDGHVKSTDRSGRNHRQNRRQTFDLGDQDSVSRARGVADPQRGLQPAGQVDLLPRVRLRGLITRYLDLITGGQQWLDCIIKPIGAEGWPISTSLTVDRVVEAVIDSEQIIGIRAPRTGTAMIINDIDHHHGRASRYWCGDSISAEVEQLEINSVAAGCSTVITRSSANGGNHAITFTPELVKPYLQHHVGAVLADQSGMEQKPGQLEIYPREQRYQPGWSKETASAHQGVRLPGQQGSAVLIGDRWESDPVRIYEILVGELEATLDSPTPIEWGQLRRAAQQRVDSQFSERRNLSYGKQRKVQPWTGSGQSNNIVRDIVWNVLVAISGGTEREIVDLAVQQLQSHPGYRRHASFETQKAIDSGAWPAAWLKCHLKRQGTAVRDERPRDTERNDREKANSWEKLRRLCRDLGDGVLKLSQRRGAELASMTRDTWRKWSGLLPKFLAEIRAERVVDTPPIKGVRQLPIAGSSDLAVVDRISKSAVSVPPASLAETEPSGVNLKSKESGSVRKIFLENLAEIRSIVESLRPPVRKLSDSLTPINRGECPAVGTVATTGQDQSSTMPTSLISDRRARERAELEAWIAAA